MTIHDPSLRAALKTLKLTGMLDTLDARLAQTRDGQLGQDRKSTRQNSSHNTLSRMPSSA